MPEIEKETDVEAAPEDLYSGLDDHFIASAVLGYLDYDAQLQAIESLIRHHRKLNEDHSKQIQKLEEFSKRSSDSANERAIEDLIDHYHHSVFQHAAHSMAAVGMLAPFIESLFYQAFKGISVFFEERGHPLELSSRAKLKDQKREWNCHYVSTSPEKANLVEGIMELAEKTGLITFMPKDIRTVLTALFGYRNKMFHNGFEWPKEKRKKFAARLATKEWPEEWFSEASSNDEPWVFYFTDTFIDHCLTTIEGVLTGLGAYVRKHR
jgi:hypothetical protein